MHNQVKSSDYNSENLFDWCANCGNYGINTAVKRSLAFLNIAPQQILMCFDIGCNGNGADKIAGYIFHGLHGRVIPLAVGASLANNRIPVLAFAGDGATLDEGIGHLIHAIRSNYNITFLLHNNSAFSLTTGQATPTSALEIPMNSAIDGPVEDPLSIMELVFSVKPTFVARGYSGQIDQLTTIITAGIKHQGFSFIEILQDCPTYNKAYSHQWYLEKVFNVQDLSNYQSNDIQMAQQIATVPSQSTLSNQDNTFLKNDKFKQQKVKPTQTEKLLLNNKDKEINFPSGIATGVLYQNKDSLPYDQRLKNRQTYATELVDEVKPFNIKTLLENFR